MPTFTDASLRRLLPRERAYRVFEGGALPGSAGEYEKTVTIFSPGTQTNTTLFLDIR